MRFKTFCDTEEPIEMKLRVFESIGEITENYAYEGQFFEALNHIK